MKEKKQLLKNIKENDVFHARYKLRECGDQKDHCFEGLLVAMMREGEMMFVDTYWGLKRWDNKKWNFKQLKENFHFEFYCNLDDLEKKDKTAELYYDDKDIFILHDQHSCVESCRYYYTKKGAVRSQKKMIATLDKKIADAKSDIDWRVREIERESAKRKEVENGNLEVYI